MRRNLSITDSNERQLPRKLNWSKERTWKHQRKTRNFLIFYWDLIANERIFYNKSLWLFESKFWMNVKCFKIRYWDMIKYELWLPKFYWLIRITSCSQFNKLIIKIWIIFITRNQTKCKVREKVCNEDNLALAFKR